MQTEVVGDERLYSILYGDILPDGMYIALCTDEEKGCSARDLVKIGSCRAENLLSNDIKYVEL